jgi:hypothetical protein
MKWKTSTTVGSDNIESDPLERGKLEHLRYP